MSKDYWFPWFPSIFQEDTLSLTAEQDGIYRRLIDFYMQHEGTPLPDSVTALSRIAGVSEITMENAWGILQAYFKHTTSIPQAGWTHNFCDKLLIEQQSIMQKRSLRGKAGAAARWKTPIDKPKENAYGMPQAMLGDATGTITITETKERKKDITAASLLTRMPHSELPSEWIVFARNEKGWTQEMVYDVWAEFKDYWQTGKGKSVKRNDWLPTWRNWVRKQNMGLRLASGKPLWQKDPFNP